MSDQKWVRTPEAALYLGLSASHLAKLRCSGGGPTFSRRGKAVLYNVEDLDGWAKAGRSGSTAEADQAAEARCTAPRR